MHLRSCVMVASNEVNQIFTYMAKLLLPPQDIDCPKGQLLRSNHHVYAIWCMSDNLRSERWLGHLQLLFRAFQLYSIVPGFQ